MDIRYSANQRDVKRYTTEELRDEFLITGLYKANEVVAVYSHVDRMVTLGCMPTTEKVSIDKGIDCWKNFGTHYFLERREIGIFNIGGEGTITADGQTFKMGYKDCLYITKGTPRSQPSSTWSAHRLTLPIQQPLFLLRRLQRDPAEKLRLQISEPSTSSSILMCLRPVSCPWV